ncbi:hypothetical protein [Halobacterium sp. KA-6]|uniref:hypothetical protein n=1 Tax=Halobacterium sp. KA-6 TaxID=2896368 RepID=UPI001E333DD9|nr:hypothetical protein [Halobacterium sp. KA-6]MCD2204405.1 hypothetical protein [Halobacterium sp. KA-6]
MSDTYLYRQAIPEQAQTRTSSQQRRQLSKLAGLQSGSSVEDLGGDPGEYTLVGQYRGKYAELMAEELEELFGPDNDFDTVPYYSQDGQLRETGYYALSNMDVGRSDPRRDSVQDFDGRLTREGTRQSHRRSLRVDPQQVHRNDYGNETSALVAIPTAAGKRTWYKRETQAREPVSVIETVQCEGSQADVDLVDARAVDFSAPYELVYDVSYDAGGQCDVILWDDHDREKIDSEGVNSWQWVFATSHEYSGVPVVDTGRLRLHLNETQGLTAETYDPTTDSWTSAGLPTSDWSLRDVDITTVSPLRVEAQLEFSHPSEGVFALNLVAWRGRDRVQLLVPDSVEAATPQGLQDYLDSIAAPEVVRSHGSLGLIAREEVRY